MLRTYYYKNFFSYACNQAVGVIAFLVYSYISYNYSSSPPLLPFIVSLIFFSLQITKGYLLYFPSTYVIFDDKGISFNKFKKEFQYINWEEINLIRLEIENEWMLNMFIEKNDGKIIRLVLSEKWLLSFSRKLCIKHNFLKLMSIAKINSILMKKLDSDEVQDFYEYCGISK